MRPNQIILLVAAVVVLVGGCRKRGGTTVSSPAASTKEKEPAAEAGKTTDATATASSAAEPANPAATGKSEFERRLYGGNPQETLRALNQLVEGWQMSNPTPLNSLEQLVAAGAMPRIPTAPAGQRYIIDPKTKVAVLTK